MRPSCRDDTGCGRLRARLQTVAGPPAARTPDVAGPSLVPTRVRARWYGYLALTVTGFATGGAPAWALAGAALACVATPLALAATYGSTGLRHLFLISRAPVTRRPNTEPEDMT
jgi:hypothetical protein